jgi:mycothiol synthase
MVAAQLLDSFAPDDVAAVREVAAAVEASAGTEPFGAETWAGLGGNGLLGDLGVLLRDDDGRPVGYAHASHHHDDHWSVEVGVVDRSTDDAVRLVRDAADAIAAHGGGHVTLWVHGADPSAADVARGAGFSHERDLLQLRVPLPLPTPPSWPTGVVVRSFRPGEDDQAWLGVNNRAFAGHPEQGGWTVQHLRQREAEDWFDPDGFLVALDDEGMAGFCWTKVHPPEPPREPEALGEIYVIGADPRWHGRGLGRALTSGGLASLADRGVTVGMLYVDGANAAAVGLYRALGFREHRVDRAYGRDVAPTSAAS